MGTYTKEPIKMSPGMGNSWLDQEIVAEAIKQAEGVSKRKG